MVFGMVLMIPEFNKLLDEGTVRVLNVEPGFPICWLLLLIMMVVPEPVLLVRVDVPFSVTGGEIAMFKLLAYLFKGSFN